MTLLVEPLKPGEDSYEPQGRLTDLWDSRGVREVVVSGPAGTGKSRGILEFLYVLAWLYPMMRILISRLTRHSLTETTLVTFENEVVTGRPAWMTNQKRRVRQSYELPNGSQIVCGGLDDTAKIMSSQYDVIYVPEAREAEEAAWEDLMSRLRNGVLPWQQIIGDTNPDGPVHWIKQRAAKGALKLIETRHDDNPRYWDEQAADWTDEGRSYVLGTLEQLTGVRYKRLRQGLWVGAEGMVYDLYDPVVHEIDPFDIPDSWRRIGVVDFGFTNAFAALWLAEDEDGRLYVYRQVYGVQTLVIDWAHLMHDLTSDEKIRYWITDHDLEARADLEAHLGHSADQCGKGDSKHVGTVPARKDVMLGIQRVSDRLKRAGDSKPRLFVLRDSLVQADPLLIERKEPVCLQDEFPRYTWATARSQTAGLITLEEPVKRHDHALDALRYGVMEADIADIGLPAARPMVRSGHPALNLPERFAAEQEQLKQRQTMPRSWPMRRR